MVKGKYINEKAHAAYKEAEKKVKPKAEGPLSKYKEEEFKKASSVTNVEEGKKITPEIEKKSSITNVKEGLDNIRDAVLGCKDDMIKIRTDMLKMMEEIDKMTMSIRVLATRLNRVDGMGK